MLVPNQPPEVRIAEAPAGADSLDPSFYHVTIYWVGTDPDGRVDHFLYAVDPTSVDRVDSTWVVTKASEQSFIFSATNPREPIDPRNPMSVSPHTVAIYAVDDRGDRSLLPATRSFFASTTAPVVTIIEPRPTQGLSPQVAATVRINWMGDDPDGQIAHRPVRYVYRMFTAINPDMPRLRDFIFWAELYPDSVRKLYAPAFEGWTHVAGDTTTAQYERLNIGTQYLFIVTGFDEAGAYDPVFTTGRNMLKFDVVPALSAAPVLTMFNQFFSYTYLTGGYDATEERWFKLEIPAGQPLTINWSATPHVGSDIRAYRWVMDLVDLDDNTPRSNQQTDWYHWSPRSRNTTSAVVGPFSVNQEEHLLYIEAEDSSGLRSLGVIRFRVVVGTFEKAVLFVDDTRLWPDLKTTPSQPDVEPPSGQWPTAAELDTFLFARGGFPWKSYPPGTLSPPGILNGYAFDTVGTRGIADGRVPLSLLARYRHVVWYVDEVGAGYSERPSSTTSPITSLRFMSAPRQAANLSTYVTMGGEAWLAGGGAAMATLIDWNRPGTVLFEYTSQDGELGPERFMYDFAHWRSSIQMLPAIQARKFGSTSFGAGPRPGRGWPGQPDYSALPATLQAKNAASDPTPPLREPNSNFYVGSYLAEYVSRPNLIRIDDDPDSAVTHLVSTLDTLYLTSGGTALQNCPVMTYYHGPDCPPIVFSGFSFWYWRRAQCIALVDFVLGRLWGLPRYPGAARTPLNGTAARQPDAAQRR